MANPAETVVVLADDLIWATRLATQLRSVGAKPVVVRDQAGFDRDLPGARAAIVDLTSRAYDGVTAVAHAADVGLAVLAVGQHDDVGLRRRALAAGAKRVVPYRRLFEDGPAVLARWLEAVPDTGPAVRPGGSSSADRS